MVSNNNFESQLNEEDMAKAKDSKVSDNPGYDSCHAETSASIRLEPRFWIALVFTIPVLLLAMAEMFPFINIKAVIPDKINLWLQLILSTPVVCWAGLPFFKWGWQSLIKMDFNMWTLISIGTGTAYLLSLLAIVVPGVFPPSVGSNGMLPLYFESAAVIITLVLFGQILEARASDKTGDAIRSLLDQSPKVACRVDESGDQIISLDLVKINDRLHVRPGDKIPVDGTILEGSSSITESMISGESIPVDKTVGDVVIGGTMNNEGAFIMKAERVGAETVLARIIDLVSKAQKSQAPIQQVADRVSAFFVPAVIAIAVITFIIWIIWGPEPRLSYALVNAVSVLIIACPCALGLATPLSIIVGVGRGAQSGVFIQDAITLETLSGVQSLLLDKTGTLTEGRPRVVEINALDPWKENEILQYAATLEKNSAHPLAVAIVGATAEKKITMLSAEAIASIPGGGIEGVINGRKIHIGKVSWLNESGVGIPNNIRQKINALSETGHTCALIAVDHVLAGYLALSDPIKKGTIEVVKNLHAMGLKLIILSGDSKSAAKATAEELGIDEFYGDLVPEEKNAFVKRMKSQHLKVAMAGDGMNDAPALIEADVGIAMGKGSDIAIESAGIILLEGDLSGIEKAFRISRYTLCNIRQNLFFAFFYNALSIPIAAGILYPFFGFLLNPMVAGAVMSMSSLSVVLNALRLRKVAL